MRLKKKKQKKFLRINLFPFMLTLVVFVIFSRLFFLQIIRGDEYKQQVNDSSVREIPDAAPRGNVIDRNGVVLATSKQSYMLVYNETKESGLNFYQTMDKVFKNLDDNKEKFEDDFELKYDAQDKENPFKFIFKTTDDSVRKSLEIRFKRDRGLNENIQKVLYKDKKEKEKLTDEEEGKINEELLKITPEQTYNLLLKQYKITPEQNFLNLLALYKINPEMSSNSLKEVFKIDTDSEFISFLEKYNKNPKDETPNILKKYGIDKLSFDIEKQRKYMIIRDEIKMQTFSGYKPITIAANISQNAAFIFLQTLNDLSGIDVNTQPIRVYPYNGLGASFLGYISKISNNQDKYAEKGYDVNSDYIGVSGLEAVLEDRLKGSKGGKVVKLNKQGRVIEELGRRDPYPGQTVKLSIDKNVQFAGEQAMDIVMKNLQKTGTQAYDLVNTTNATRGAMAAINVKTGEIIALVSRPSFDPNVFAVPGRLTDELFNQYFNPNIEEFAKNYIKNRGLSVSVDDLFPIDKDVTKKANKTIRKDQYDIIPKPFYNYATSSLIPPGSTFKPLTAVAGLQEGVITPNETIYDAIVYTKNNYNGKDWNTTSYGAVDVAKALEVSNNHFFFEVGDRLLQKGIDTLAKYAWKFGLGADPNGKQKAATGIEIAENFGQVFNVFSAKKIFSATILSNLCDELLRIRTGKNGSADDGINIVSKDEDSNDVKNLKKDIRDTITRQMVYKDVENFTTIITSKIKSLIEAIPEYKEKNFTSGDIKSAVQKVNFAVDEVTREATRPGNVYNAAIGQGINQFTPLQLASYISTIVNGGTRYKLHLVQEYLDSGSNTSISKVKPEVIEKIELEPSTINAVKIGMLKVNTGEEGTAGEVFKDLEKANLVTAGKTGSATFSDKQDSIGRTSYGIYVGFAPYDNPEIAVCAIIFDGGHGGFVAPVAKAVYEAYFMNQLKKANYVPQPIYDGTPNFIKDLYDNSK